MNLFRKVLFDLLVERVFIANMEMAEEAVTCLLHVCYVGHLRPETDRTANEHGNKCKRTLQGCDSIHKSDGTSYFDF